MRISVDYLNGAIEIDKEELEDEEIKTKDDFIDYIQGKIIDEVEISTYDTELDESDLDDIEDDLSNV